MKLYSIKTEAKALKTMCESKMIVGSHVLASVDADSFHYAPFKEAFKRLQKIVKKTGNIPDWAELCADPSISQDARKVLARSEEVEAGSKIRARSIVKTLDKYRQLRGLLRVSDTILKTVKEDNVDIDELIDLVSDGMANVRSKVNSKKQIIHIGKGNNATDLVKKILRGSAQKILPTGFKAWDSVNGGMPEGGLVVIAGTTGGGKTTLAGQMILNGALQASENCAIVPLEMTDVEMMTRNISNLSDVEVGKFTQAKLSDGERKRAWQSYVSMVKKLKKSDTRYSIFAPDEDMTIEEILFTLRPYGYKAIAIDYISLLKDVDGEDQWRQLGKVARFAKVFAKSNKITVFLLAQLNKEGLLRYSQAVGEHADVCLTWVATDEAKESGIIDIIPTKSRNMVPVKFSLKMHFATMKVTDVSEEDMDRMRSKEPGDEDSDQEYKPSKKNKNKSKNKKKPRESKDEYLEEIG